MQTKPTFVASPDPLPRCDWPVQAMQDVQPADVSDYVDLDLQLYLKIGFGLVGNMMAAAVREVL